MARPALTRLRVFDYLCDYKASNDGHAPTYMEIARHFNWRSVSTAWVHVMGLQRDGLIVLDQNRRISLIGGQYIPPPRT